MPGKAANSAAQEAETLVDVDSGVWIYSTKGGAVVVRRKSHALLAAFGHSNLVYSYAHLLALERALLSLSQQQVL